METGYLLALRWKGVHGQMKAWVVVTHYDSRLDNKTVVHAYGPYKNKSAAQGVREQIKETHFGQILNGSLHCYVCKIIDIEELNHES